MSADEQAILEGLLRERQIGIQIQVKTLCACVSLALLLEKP